MLKFKTKKLKTELFDIAQTDPRVRALTQELGFWAQKLFTKDLVITCVWRTEEEQVRIYGKPVSSAHFCQPQCRAVDVRANHDYFTQNEMQNLDSFIKKYFPRKDGLSPIVFHGEGDNFHIHLSVEPLSD